METSTTTNSNKTKREKVDQSESATRKKLTKKDEQTSSEHIDINQPEVSNLTRYQFETLLNRMDRIEETLLNRMDRIELAIRDIMCYLLK